MLGNDWECGEHCVLEMGGGGTGTRGGNVLERREW